MEHFEAGHREIVEEADKRSFNRQRIAKRMRFSSVDVVNAHLDLERLRQAATHGSESPQQEQERLIAEARAYLSLVSERTQQLEQMRDYVQTGDMPQDVFEHFERQYSELVAAQQTEAELQHRLSLLRQQLDSGIQDEATP